MLRLGFLTLIFVALSASSLAEDEVPSADELIEAVKKADIESIERYLAKGGDINAMHCKAFELAYSSCDRTTAEYLVSRGAAASPKAPLNGYRRERLILDGNSNLLRVTLKLYAMDHEEPPTEEQLTKFYLEQSDRKKWPQDSWGHPIFIRIHGKNVTAGSYGSDGKPGGTGSARDVLSTYTDEGLLRYSREGDPKGLCRDPA